MNEGVTPTQGDIISFGPFRLFSTARVLEKDGTPLALGARALDILIVLVERAGEVVSHRELLTRVWRGLVVDPSNLRVHITGLRKALGDTEGSERYIANIVGQGYSFVAPIQHELPSNRHPQLPDYPCGGARQRLLLPPVQPRMVGREQTVRTVAADLIADRFVTIIGAGGVGKTTVAVSVAHALFEEFHGAVCFVDLAVITDPKLVAATIASTLGLTVQTQDVLTPLMLCLRTLRVLLVLDNCEHVVDAAATLAERIFQEAPAVHILATSREALRVEGERAYWLPPLDGPPPDRAVSAADALKYPAIKLFMDRATASGSHLELSDEDASIVAEICDRLDGIPLAIEFAASRVGVHGLAETAQLLKTRLGLQWPGRRTALPRHQTLRGLLDWSFELLQESEQVVLRRLSIFVGAFALDAAQIVASDDTLRKDQIVGAVDALVSKSLVSAVTTGDKTRYRLLMTTRVYALEKLEECGEMRAIAHRHAEYFVSLLRGVVLGAALSEHLGNMRAALEWAFGEEAHDRALAVDLAASAVPVFLELSLLTEAYRWSAAALDLLDATMSASRQEMELQEALAISTTWTMGNHERVRTAIARALEIAQSLGDTTRRLRLLAGEHVYLMRVGALRQSLTIAEEFASIVGRDPEASLGAVADCLLGGSHHFMGNQPIARAHLERGLSFRGPHHLQLFGLDSRLRALVTFGRVLWMSGKADRTLATAREALRVAEESNRPLSVCFSFLYTAPLFLWCGEVRAAREVIEKLMAHPNWHALPSLHDTAFALQAAVLIREGHSEQGIALIRSAVSNLRADRQNLLLAGAVSTLAKGLAAAGQHEEALAVVSAGIAESDDDTERSHLPELLRIQAEILLALPGLDERRAEQVLEESLTLAREQGALAWELRTTMTLARLRAKQNRAGEGRASLSAVYARFTEGFETADLQAARLMLRAEGTRAAAPTIH